jgi:hypothetical protein
MSQTTRDVSKRTMAKPADYNQLVFRDKNLLLFDVLRAVANRGQGLVINNATFENCQIDGPAVLLPLNNCNFDDCNFNAEGGDMRNLIMRPDSPTRITGAIAMNECKFFGVDFFGVGFTGNQVFLDSLLQVGVREP